MIPQLPPVFRNKIQSVRASSLPYHLADTKMLEHWKHTGAGEGIVVGIADTGLDISHPEIGDPDRIVASKSFVGRRQGRGIEDGNDHGTHVATTIGGVNVGMAPRCRFVIAKVLGDNGSGPNQGVAEGIAWMVDQGVHVINLSLGGTRDDAATREAIAYAKSKFVLIAAATGNERANHVGYPARHCAGIGAVDRGMKLAYFSNRGKAVDLVGYGVDVYAGVPGGHYQEMSGTSMATPFIVGVAANRLSAELKHLGEIITKTDEGLLKLETFTTDLGAEGKDTSYGRGFPDLNKIFYNNLTLSEPVQPKFTHTVRVEDIHSETVFTGLLQPERVGA